MNLAHGSGSQEDQLDENKWSKKISWYYPFKENLYNNATFDPWENSLEIPVPLKSCNREIGIPNI